MCRRKIIFIFIFICSICLFCYQQSLSAEIRKLIVFYSPACHKCIEIKRELMPAIEKEFKGQIRIEYRDISELENYKFLLGLQEEYKSDIALDLPVFFFAGRFLNAKDKDMPARLRQVIGDSLARIHKEKNVPAVDLAGRFNAISPFIITSVGLIDGINPCAFTVIVFFISFLTLQGYRKKELLLIGLTFIATVFFTYLLIGLGLFSFFYRLEGFWLLAKIVNFSVGIFSIILGIFALYDSYKFKQTGQTDGLILQLPQRIKNKIHSVVGWHYRQKGAQEIAGPKRHILRLVLSALATGFLVSILEAVCTGQTYLPTIVFILKTSFRLKALVYLLLYNLMFIVPLLAIFFLALSGVTSGQFSKFLKRYLLLAKVLLAVLFFSLGIFLIWRG